MSRLEEDVRRRSELVLEHKLHYPRTVKSVDDLQSSETRFRQKIASLTLGKAISTVAPHRLILQWIRPVSVLDIVVRVVEEVECLGLERDALIFRDCDVAGQSEVHLLCPGTIERIQTYIRAWPAAINAQGGVRRGLVHRGVVQIVSGAVTVSRIKRRT